MYSLFFYPNCRTVRYETRGHTVALERGSSVWRYEVPQVYEFLGILGILRQAGSEFLLFVREAEGCGEWREQNLYKIKRVGFVPLSTARTSEEVENVCKLMEEYEFYYTFGSDLSEELASKGLLWNKSMKERLESHVVPEAESRTQEVDLWSLSPKSEKNQTRKKSNRMKLADLMSGESHDANTRTVPLSLGQSHRLGSEQNIAVSSVKSRAEDARPGKSSVSAPNISEHGTYMTRDGTHKAQKISPVSSKEAERMRMYCETGSNPDYMVVSLFCGYFETKTILLEKQFTFRILSAISTERIGTRLLSRGVDEEGNTSFMVETRFLVTTEEKVDGDSESSARKYNKLFDFTILRGTVPLFWTQPDPLKPTKIVFGENGDENERAFVRHFDKLERIYSSGQEHRVVVVVDLLGRRESEKILRESYRAHCEKYGIGYVHVDVNKHAERFDWLKRKFSTKLARFVADMRRAERLNNSSKSSLADTNTEENNGLEGKETGGERLSQKEVQGYIRDKGLIFRVNCLDCLDRTNIGQLILFNYFSPYDTDIAINMWRRNGDALSNFYTGSDALKAELSKKGKLTFLEKMNDLWISASRMIKNKFSDKIKQRSIDILLGKI